MDQTVKKGLKTAGLLAIYTFLGLSVLFWTGLIMGIIVLFFVFLFAIV
jgi:hypothetical protein